MKLKKNITKVIKNSLNTITNKKSGFIKQIFKNKDEYLDYKKEIEESSLINDLENKKNIFLKTVKGETSRGNKYGFGSISYQDGILLYSIIRKFRPNILVETGVCNGVSTSFILYALFKNNYGKLYSIDFPEIANTDYEKNIFWKGKGGAIIPQNHKSGWIIPNYLRAGWELTVGKSQDKLPKLLEKLKNIDFFMHDSEHSYECMTFEFNKSFNYLKKNGILLSDDITWNNSFFDFCKKHKIKPITSHEIGFILKKF